MELLVSWFPFQLPNAVHQFSLISHVQCHALRKKCATPNMASQCRKLNHNIILTLQLWTLVTGTSFINRNYSSSTESCEAADQEKYLSCGPQMFYWLKRIDVQKYPIVSGYLEEISQAAYLTPNLWKREVKSQGENAMEAWDRKQIKKDPILIFISAHIGSLRYLCSHRLFQRTLTFPQQN